METLQEFPQTHDDDIAELRAIWQRDQTDASAIALGLSLAESGCSYEAAVLLRPRRKLWKDQKGAETGRAALEAQTWWNKNWQSFAQARQAGRYDEALDLLGARAPLFWDMPPVLMHLGAIALHQGDLALAEHIFKRVSLVAEGGLPKMDMSSFAYASSAQLVDVLVARGDIDAALSAYARVKPNQGNAMAHELQGARLMALAGREDQAMAAVAQIITTAEQARRGYSRDMRLDFVDNDPSLAALRDRADWSEMRSGAKAWSAKQT